MPKGRLHFKISRLSKDQRPRKNKDPGTVFVTFHGICLRASHMAFRAGRQKTRGRFLSLFRMAGKMARVVVVGCHG